MAAINFAVLFLTFVWKKEVSTDRQKRKAARQQSPEIAMTSLKGAETPGIEVTPGATTTPSSFVDQIGATAEGAPALADHIPTAGAKDRAVFTNKTVWITCGFLLLYVVRDITQSECTNLTVSQGAEVSLGGWCVSFLIETREGGSSVGYVAVSGCESMQKTALNRAAQSGFWGGITLGEYQWSKKVDRVERSGRPHHTAPLQSMDWRKASDLPVLRARNRLGDQYLDST